MSTTYCEKEDAIFIYKIHSPQKGGGGGLIKIEIHALCFITNMVIRMKSTVDGPSKPQPNMV